MKHLCLMLTVLFVSVASLGQQRMALIEMTTSVNCHNCPGGNDYIDSLALLHPGKILILRYQAPLYGIDPIFIQDSAEINARLRFMLGPHPQFGLPGSYLNGDTNMISPRFLTFPMIDSVNHLPAHFSLTVNHQFTPDFDSLSVTVSLLSDAVQTFAPGALRLTLVMMEDSIHMASPPGNNGEKDFFFECRKFVTGVGGDTLPHDWSAGQLWTRTFTMPVPGYIYDLNNIYFLGMAQDLSDRSMLQAARSEQFKAPHYAGIDKQKSLVFPAITCANALTGVKVWVKNLGTSPLMSFSLLCRQNQNIPDTIHWSGLLFPDSTARVDLPDFPLGTDGKHTIDVRVIRPNGTHIADSWACSFSNTIESNHTADPPPIQAWFTDPHFPYHGWCVFNPSRDGNTWQRVAPLTTPGNYPLPTLQLRCFGMSEGTVNEFFMPETDITHLSSIALSFSVAHIGGQTDDTLKVLLTTDCGETWHTVFSKYSAQFSLNSGGSFEFLAPPDSTDETRWKFQSVDLSSFAGNQKIQLKFHYIHETSNNIYIRRIYLGPHAAIGEAVEPSIRVFPNPVYGDQVTVEWSETTGLQQIDVISPAGNRLLQLAQAAGIRTVLRTTDWSAGIYLLRITTQTGVYTRKLVVM